MSSAIKVNCIFFALISRKGHFCWEAMGSRWISPLAIHWGSAGVLWRVIRWRRDGRDELVEVQGLVEDGSVGGHAVSIQGSCSVRHKLRQPRHNHCTKYKKVNASLEQKVRPNLWDVDDLPFQLLKLLFKVIQSFPFSFGVIIHYNPYLTPLCLMMRIKLPCRWKVLEKPPPIQQSSKNES